jgi:hypothetical protein
MSIIIQDIRQKIWTAAKKDKDKVHAAMVVAGENDNTERYWKSVLQQLKPKKKRAVVDDQYKQRYIDAHVAWQCVEYPNAVKDHGALPTDIPDTATANGLTRFICQYLYWIGQRATRISVEGRVLGDGTRIASSTRKGTADISSTINGKSVMWEVKTGRDKPSPEQLKEQARERRAGGEYFFTHSVEEFFSQLDSVSQQKVLF